MCFVTVDVFQRPIGALFIIATATALSLACRRACWLCYAKTHYPLCQLPTHCSCRCRGKQMCLAWLSGLSDCCSSEKLRSAIALPSPSPLSNASSAWQSVCNTSSVEGLICQRPAIVVDMRWSSGGYHGLSCHLKSGSDGMYLFDDAWPRPAEYYF